MEGSRDWLTTYFLSEMYSCSSIPHPGHPDPQHYWAGSCSWKQPAMRAGHMSTTQNRAVGNVAWPLQSQVQTRSSWLPRPPDRVCPGTPHVDQVSPELIEIHAFLGLPSAGISGVSHHTQLPGSFLFITHIFSFQKITENVYLSQDFL